MGYLSGTIIIAVIISEIGNLAIAVNHRRLAFRRGRDLLNQHMKFWATEKYVSLLSHIKCNLYLYVCMVCGMLFVCRNEEEMLSNIQGVPGLVSVSRAPVAL